MAEYHASLERNCVSRKHSTWSDPQIAAAFAVTAPGKVKGRSQAGRLADLVALVRFALEQQPELEPFAESVNARFESRLTVGATFYLEPVATLDVDIFVVVESVPGSLIAGPKRIYDNFDSAWLHD